MSSHSRNPSRALALVAVSLALALTLALTGPVLAQQAGAAPGPSGSGFIPTTTLFPGGGKPPPEDPRGKLYDGKPDAIAQGEQLFNWYNCSGCHFHGAGGMGPALMDPQWRYGGRIDQIYATIVQGRPNGMPSWGGKIPDAEIWKIAAYVRSLSARSTATGGPGESMPQPPPPAAAAPPAPEISPK